MSNAAHEHVTDHTFVGMAVRAETSEGRVVDGAIAGIWTVDGEPVRFDIDDRDGDGDRLLNIDPDRVEVGG